jgi:hypothetical protein
MTMFYNQQYNKYVVEGTAFELGDIQYPANWLNLSTPEQKVEAGLVEVVATNQPANQTYYWVSETLNGADLTYTNTPKDLEQLKVSCTAQVNSTAYSLLFPTDWMVVKAVETQGTVPTDWNSYREAVRTTADLAKSEIAICATVDALETAMNNVAWPVSPDAPVQQGAA